jgi:hypothetical protein
MWNRRLQIATSEELLFLAPASLTSFASVKILEPPLGLNR